MLVLDSDGVERTRIEGYLPKEEFRAELEMGLARVAFMHKHWADAERMYTDIANRFPNSKVAPEAIYWTAVSRYKATNDHTVLGGAPAKLNEKYPDSVWTSKASVWAD